MAALTINTMLSKQRQPGRRNARPINFVNTLTLYAGLYAKTWTVPDRGRILSDNTHIRFRNVIYRFGCGSTLA